MNLLENTFNQINSGGTVMWILIALSFLIWALICKFLLDIDLESDQGYFKHYKKYIETIDLKNSTGVIDLISSRISLDEKVIKSLIAIAPLLGLLGTVGGMIETFASLETMEMFKPSGGIAAGVSQALLTTQFGLIVAVPAVLFLRFVDKKKRQLVEELKIILSERVQAYEV